jgi:hypothetical protein
MVLFGGPLLAFILIMIFIFIKIQIFSIKSDREVKKELARRKVQQKF